jgi:hypothetical protein
MYGIDFQSVVSKMKLNALSFRGQACACEGQVQAREADDHFGASGIAL